ncbi:Ribosomal 50S subunit-recycling heat shock protein, contains S4 domain [Fictibacillus solisalsi]|uniref:RQC P-site tRNA stabilizing factor n=1 Tax=Fictibacillus solisalsi TaxID=459525 RepID=A0A1H0CG99_9BACL|nr:RNA-binding S4 domain-containing protein [Fictibacillus solisalsi]SDN56843.1 Ribosomal 50S subunit-recycling heat shock protein, contains S4 domain [Fictibacillus solisalsi]
MRLDKFLKVSRLIKRRTVAKEISDQGRIAINGKQAKSSSVLKAGDELKIRFGQKLVTVRVDELKEFTKKEDAAGMYTIINEESLQSTEEGPKF